ncbi:MAG: HEAT repeat domain-containing protein, partial [Halobacteria archaeon]|nr:HEAT repeat domain-containing protein [Halobacteria archaeon]
DNDSARVRGAVADALGAIGDESAVNELGNVLENDGDESVRISAAKALNEIGGDDAEKILDDYKNDRNELVAKAAKSATAEETEAEA